jgi:hypothetical protein
MQSRGDGGAMTIPAMTGTGDSHSLLFSFNTTLDTERSTLQSAQGRTG